MTKAIFYSLAEPSSFARGVFAAAICRKQISELGGGQAMGEGAQAPGGGGASTMRLRRSATTSGGAWSGLPLANGGSGDDGTRLMPPEW